MILVNILPIFSSDTPSYCVKPLDIMLVIDTSNSMVGQRLADAKTAAKNFIDLIPNETRVGIISFNCNVKLESGLVNLTTANRVNLKNKINSFVASGSTSTGNAILEAQNEINSNARKNSNHIIIFLSDGSPTSKKSQCNLCDQTPTRETTCTRYAKDQATASKEKGTIIYSIGLNLNTATAQGKFAESFMKNISSSDDKYYPSPDSSDLLKIYFEIAVNICFCGNNVLDLDEECDDGNLINRDGCSDACKIERCNDAEDCANHIDDDCDNEIDCEDSDCINSTICAPITCTPIPEICNNNIDDDCDNLIDCSDTDCLNKSAEICNNNIDDDCNGKIDCEDRNCKNQQICVQRCFDFTSQNECDNADLSIGRVTVNEQLGDDYCDNNENLLYIDNKAYCIIDCKCRWNDNECGTSYELSDCDLEIPGPGIGNCSSLFRYVDNCNTTGKININYIRKWQGPATFPENICKNETLELTCDSMQKFSFFSEINLIIIIILIFFIYAFIRKKY